MTDVDERIFLVGLGASAGGLEAIRTTLNGAPCRTSDCTRIEDAFAYTTDPILFSGRRQPALDLLREHTCLTRFGGDCYCYALLASGHCDIVLETGLEPYDYLPVVKVVEGAGGVITDRFWVPLGSKDFASIIAALPDDVDALYLGLGGGDAVNFLNQYQQAGGEANLIGGTIMVDGTVLNATGRAQEMLIGTPSSGPQADDYDSDDWRAFVQAYQDAREPENRFPSPSLVATTYYNSTKAALMCIDDLGGDLGEGQMAFRECLSGLEMDAPNGKITLDENRQAIGTNFVTEVFKTEDGNLGNKLVKVVADVNQTLGKSKAEFDALGLPSRDVVECSG